MTPNNNNDLEEILDWCASVLGPCEVVADQSREHAGERAAAYRLHTASGYCYVKIHQDRSHWHSETHAYERWAPAFGALAPRLLAVRDETPLALVVSALPGQTLEGWQLAAPQVQAVWRAAGQALAVLHDHAVGEFFGPCRRDGTSANTPIYEARAYILANLETWTEKGLRAGHLTDDELAFVRRVSSLVSAFEGERPVPCHRDYSPANWLVSGDGAWTGVIDFEFSSWDVRVADFTRYPDWEWITRPELMNAFFEGYGRSLTPKEEQQRWVTHTLYALSAIVWGEENAYHGFAAEGRQAIQHLAGLLG